MVRGCEILPQRGYLRFAVTYRVFKTPFLGNVFGKWILNMFRFFRVSGYSYNILKIAFPKMRERFPKNARFWGFSQIWDRFWKKRKGRENLIFGGQLWERKTSKDVAKKEYYLSVKDYSSLMTPSRTPMPIYWKQTPISMQFIVTLNCVPTAGAFFLSEKITFKRLRMSIIYRCTIRCILWGDALMLHSSGDRLYGPAFWDRTMDLYRSPGRRRGFADQLSLYPRWFCLLEHWKYCDLDPLCDAGSILCWNSPVPMSRCLLLLHTQSIITISPPVLASHGAGTGGYFLHRRLNI